MMIRTKTLQHTQPMIIRLSGMVNISRSLNASTPGVFADMHATITITLESYRATFGPIRG